MAANPNNLTPSIDSDVIHKLALQSDYVARYAELAEACRLVILRTNAAATPDVGLTDIQAVLTDTIPRSTAPANADEDGTGAELTKNLIARSLNTAVAAAAAAAAPAAAPVAAQGGAQAAAQGAQAAQAAPAAPDAVVLAQFKSTIKDECSNALQKFRTFYNENKTNIVNLKKGIETGPADVLLNTATVFRAFRRPQTGGKRVKKSQKKSKKSRK